jgi:hypothetical protein
MTTLPATLGEAEALAFARADLACLREHRFSELGIDVRMFDEGDNRRYARQAIKVHALSHPLKMMDVADGARAGWRLAEEALRELIIEYLDRGEPMPTYLAAYNMELARGRRPHEPGPQKEDRFLRDVALVVAVERIAGKFQLKTTRSRSGKSKRPSACSIDAQAAGLGESSIVKLWQRFGELACVAYHARRPL